MATRFIGDTVTIEDIVARLAALEVLAGLGANADHGDIVTSASGTTWSFKTSVVSAFSRTLLDDLDQAAAQTTLGVRVGSDVQAWDAELAAVSALTSAANKLPYFTGSGTAALADFTVFARTLIDDADGPAMRITLGLGSLATLSTINNSNWSGTALSVANGGTGATTQAGAQANLGLGPLATLSAINNSNWSGTALSVANGGTGATTQTGAQTNLGLVPGTNIQAFSARLLALAGMTYSSGVVIPALSASNTYTPLVVGIGTGQIPDSEGVRDLIGATLIPGAGLYTIVNDTADTVTFARDDRAGIVAEPFYLPQITSSGGAYHSVVSLERLLPTFSGALANVGSDIGAGATGITPSAIVAARGASAIARIATLYDQSGNGRNATQATSGTRPGLMESILCHGKPMIIFDGKRSDLTDKSPHAVGFDLTLSLNSRANTRIMLVDPTDSIIAQVLERCDSLSQKNLYTFTQTGFPFTPAANGNIQYGDGSAAHEFPVKLPSSPVVLAMRDSSTGQDLFVNGTKYTSTVVPASGTLTAWHWGTTTDTQFWPNFRGMAYITLSGTISDHDIQQITKCLLFRWGVLNGKLPRIGLIGDSISEGVASDTTRNGPFYWRDDIGQAIELYNWGIAGKLLSQCYSDRVATDGSIYDSTRPMVYVIQAGINDIHASGLAGATLYSSYTTPYISYLKGLASAAGVDNVRVLVCTLTPQTAHVTTSIETERNNYNAAVRANAGGADGIIDLAADPRMGLYPATPNDTTLMPDGIHPTSLGYSYEGPIVAAAMRAALASISI